MLIRIRMNLAFNISNTKQVDKLREAILPFLEHAVVINEGEELEERGYVIAENCGHDETPPASCEQLARWEVGRGRVL